MGSVWATVDISRKLYSYDKRCKPSLGDVGYMLWDRVKTQIVDLLEELRFGRQIVDK